MNPLHFHSKALQSYFSVSLIFSFAAFLSYFFKITVLQKPESQLVSLIAVELFLISLFSVFFIRKSLISSHILPLGAYLNVTTVFVLFPFFGFQELSVIGVCFFVLFWFLLGLGSLYRVLKVVK